ncbi:MAG: riboflavin synthase [Opitutaceae bacterium]|tara:strand:- start:1270 stop:1866 length:597 start_codon:yes stop_codon:yes gene_type:complete
MFTGIIEETGNVLSFAEGAQSWRLEIEAHRALEEAALGDSIAVNGCCLTIVEFDESKLVFDVLAESRRLTTFESLTPGSLVNLERAARFNGKMGGHFVTGHIDGVGQVRTFEQRGQDTFLKVQAPEGLGRYLVHKGSVAIDGISLTVAEVAGDGFAVWLIPHTLKETNLQTKSVGEGVNLEFDQLGKYVEKLVAPTLA